MLKLGYYQIEGFGGARVAVSQAIKQYQERHKQLGLCIRCNRKAKTGMLHCQVCLTRMRKWKMTRHPLFCPECRKLIKPKERHGGKRFHKRCSQKRRLRTYPQQHRTAAIAYQRRHRKMGLCTSCPRKAFKGGMCRRHYGMVLERYYERAAG